MSNPRAWCVCAALLSASPALFAVDPPPAENLVDMSLEDLMQMRVDTVYGASKYEQKVTQAPASVTIVTADEIARFGHRTLAEVLRSIRGLYVSDDRNYAYVGARGFLRPGDYNSRMLVLIDGHRMNDAIYDAAFIAREGLLAVDVIERVEFVRGPSSSIYGSSAFFGIVNVVTKSGNALEGLELSAGLGSLGACDARFVYGGSLPGEGEGEFSVIASYYTSDGEDRLYFREFDPVLSGDSRATNGGIASELDAEDAYGLLARATRGEFSFSASFLSRRKDVPTASFGTAFNLRERTADYRSYLDVKYEHAFAPDLQLLARASYDRYDYYGLYPYDYAAPGDPPDYITTRDSALGTWLSTEWQLTRTVAKRHTLLLGFEYRASIDQDLTSYEVADPRFYSVDVHHHGRNAALFGQGEFLLSEQVRLNAGLRYDYYDDSFGGTLNPRVGLIWSPHAKTTFKALYGQAFRAPSAYERFYYPANLGEVLDPEKIRTYELAFEQYIGVHDRLNISVYRYDVSGLITQLANSARDIYFSNLSAVGADGIEFELEHKAGNGMLARASYTLQRTEDESTGRVLTSSPRHLLKVNVATPLGKRWHGGLELYYHGPVETLLGARAGGFVLSNLNVSSEPLAYGLQFSGGIYNLLDKRYGYPGAEDHLQEVIEQNGRTARVGLTRKF